MTHWKWGVGMLAVLGVVAFVLAMAFGQPPPPGVGNWGQRQRQGLAQNRPGAQRPAVTPEQAAQFRLDTLAQAIGTQVGIADQDKQALSLALKEQEAIRQELRQKLQALRQALRRGTDADIAQRLSEYRTAMQSAKTRLAAAEETLTKALNLAERPKLEAALLIFGVLDNGMPPGGMMGMGGRRAGQGPWGEQGGRRQGPANPPPEAQ